MTTSLAKKKWSGDSFPASPNSEEERIFWSAEVKAHTAPEVRDVQSSGSGCSNSSHFAWPCSHYPKASVFLLTFIWGVRQKRESTSPSFLKYKIRKIVHPGWFVVFTLFKVFDAKKYIYVYIYIHTHACIYSLSTGAIANIMLQLRTSNFFMKSQCRGWPYFWQGFLLCFHLSTVTPQSFWGSLRTHWGDCKLSPIIFLPESALKSTLL